MKRTAKTLQNTNFQPSFLPISPLTRLLLCRNRNPSCVRETVTSHHLWATMSLTSTFTSYSPLGLLRSFVATAVPRGSSMTSMSNSFVEWLSSGDLEIRCATLQHLAAILGRKPGGCVSTYSWESKDCFLFV